MAKKNISVEGLDIRIKQKDGQDYISLTDIAKRGYYSAKGKRRRAKGK